jgi:TetR/AcrR family transcriptional regulator of autoinduction and epiphytic fitness
MGRKEIDASIILDAATKAFLANGFNATTMTEIAMTAAVTKRTLYKYYSSKDDIFNEIVDNLLDQLAQIDFQTITSSDRPIDKKISVFSKAIVDVYVSPAFVNLSKLAFSEFLNGRSLSSHQMEKYAQFENSVHRFLIGISQESGVAFAFSVEFLSEQLLSMLKGAFLYPKIFNMKEIDEKDIAQKIGEIEEFFILAAIKKR